MANLVISNMMTQYELYHRFHRNQVQTTEVLLCRGKSDAINKEAINNKTMRLPTIRPTMIRLPTNEADQNLPTDTATNDNTMRLLTYAATNNDEATNNETDCNDTNNSDTTKRGYYEATNQCSCQVASYKANDNEAVDL